MRCLFPVTKKGLSFATAIVAVVVGLCMPAAVEAQRTGSVVDTVNWGAADTNYKTNFTGDLISIAQYSPGVSTHLTSMNITFTGNIEQVYRFNITNGSANGTLEADFHLYDPSHTQLITTNTNTITIAYGTPAHPVTVDTGTQTVTTTATDSSTNVPGTNGNGTVFTTANLATYTGTGTVNFQIDGQSLNSITTSGTVSHPTNTYIYGTLTITYNYITVPEPANWAWLISISLTGSWALSRKRRRTPKTRSIVYTLR